LLYFTEKIISFNSVLKPECYSIHQRDIFPYNFELLRLLNYAHGLHIFLKISKIGIELLIIYLFELSSVIIGIYSIN